MYNVKFETGYMFTGYSRLLSMPRSRVQMHILSIGLWNMAYPLDLPHIRASSYVSVIVHLPDINYLFSHMLSCYWMSRISG